MRYIFLRVLTFVLWCLIASTATASQVHFPLFDGSTNPILRNITVTPTPATAVQKIGNRTFIQPSFKTRGGATTNILSADYTWQIEGFSTIYHMSVPNTNVVLEAADLSTDLTTYTYTNAPIIAFAAQAAQSGLVNTNDARAVLLTNAASQFVGTFSGDGSRLTGIASEWAATTKFLLAATSAGEFQLLSATCAPDGGPPTNGVVLWPDGTYGLYSCTAYNADFYAVDAYTITYTNGGKTITQALVSRDQFGNATNVPALVITP